MLPLLAAAHPFSLAYSSSVTGSHHSLLQSLPGTSTAMWLNQLSALAPCQCLTLAGMVITVPGVRLTAGLPSSWYQPSPAVQTSSWPPPLAAWWMCQLLRHRCQKHSAAQIHVSQLKFLYPLKTLVFPAFSPPRFGPFPSFFPLREEMRETFFRPSLQPYPVALRKFAWPLWWRGRKCSSWYLHQNVPAAPAHP